jgi:hypothetical protein
VDSGHEEPREPQLAWVSAEHGQPAETGGHHG